MSEILQYAPSATSRRQQPGVGYCLLLVLNAAGLLCGIMMVLVGASGDGFGKVGLLYLGTPLTLAQLVLSVASMVYTSVRPLFAVFFRRALIVEAAVAITLQMTSLLLVFVIPRTGSGC